MHSQRKGEERERGEEDFVEWRRGENKQNNVLSAIAAFRPCGPVSGLGEFSLASDQ